jgi:hypothetical protein
MRCDVPNDWSHSAWRRVWDNFDDVDHRVGHHHPFGDFPECRWIGNTFARAVGVVRGSAESSRASWFLHFVPDAIIFVASALPR